MVLNELAHLAPLSNSILSLVLLVLWSAQREERHALYWSGAHALRALMFLLWFYLQEGNAFPGDRLLLLTIYAVEVTWYVQGTFFFMRSLERMHQARQVFVAVMGVMLVANLADPRWGEVCGALIHGALHAWVGYQLWRSHKAFRVVAAVQFAGALLSVAAALRFGEVTGKPMFYFGIMTLHAANLMTMVYLFVKDVTQRFPSAAQHLSDALWIHDRQGIVVFANPACARLFGREAVSEIVGRRITEFMPILTDEMVRDVHLKLSDPSVSHPLHHAFQCPRPDGSSFPAEALVSPFQQGVHLYCMAQLRDISERQAQAERLRRASEVDEVTELANRHALNRCLREKVHGPASHALLFLDLDHFKRINDSLDHALGDQLLRSLGERLRHVVGPQGFVARFGGDEFAILVSDEQGFSLKDEALDLAQRLNQHLRMPFVLDGLSVTVTGSVGVALMPEHASDGNGLLRCADNAMYAAKRGGRNQMCLFNPAQEQRVRDSFILDSELRRALGSDEFHLVYQPIVGGAEQGQALCKVEALLRWNSSRLGFVPPDRFIPVAEDSGLVVPLGNWVLNEGCRQLAEWRQVGAGAAGQLIMSVNVAASQLADQAFLDVVRRALQRHSLKPSDLELELTERILIEEDPQVSHNLNALHAMGVRLALDDFGTGYSSLNYLNRFRLDTLKMDRSFIGDLETDRRCQDLTRHIIAMGQTLGLKLVAEGVETTGQAERLIGYGCDFLQGYLFAKPLKAKDLAGQYFESTLSEGGVAPTGNQALSMPLVSMKPMT